MRISILARVVGLLGFSGLCAVSGPAEGQQIFFGVADQWQNLVAQPESWPFVQRNADGFYANFIMMNRVIRHTATLSEETLRRTCALFSTHAAFLESDIRSADAGLEATHIHMLHQAGCTIPYTSLNYGWSAERAENLTRVERSEPTRLNFVQTGPWVLNGDIAGPSAPGRPGYNEQLRGWLRQADGISTDGPLGYWAADYKGFRSADISIVRYAHQLHKRAMIMLSPYAGGQSDVYEPKRDLLATGQDMVRTMEARGAIPDIWAVFEYATNIPPTPEQVGGRPVNSMAGLAFWLIHHVHDPSHWAMLDVVPQTEPGPVQAVVRNTSDWLDVSPLLRLRLTGATRDVRVRLMLDGTDVTDKALGEPGLALTGALSLAPGAQHHLALSMTRAGAIIAADARFAENIGRGPRVELTLAPNPGVPGEIHQRLVIPLTPVS